MVSRIAFGVRFIRPKLDVAIDAKGALAHDATKILDGDLPVAKDIQVVANDVTVAALGARY